MKWVRATRVYLSLWSHISNVSGQCLNSCPFMDERTRASSVSTSITLCSRSPFDDTTCATASQARSANVFRGANVATCQRENVTASNPQECRNYEMQISVIIVSKFRPSWMSDDSPYWKATFFSSAPMKIRASTAGSSSMTIFVKLPCFPLAAFCRPKKGFQGQSQ